MLSGALPADASQAMVATASLVQALADQHGVSREAIVLAWLLRHPAQTQPVIGTTRPARIRTCAQALGMRLSREE